MRARARARTRVMARAVMSAAVVNMVIISLRTLSENDAKYSQANIKICQGFFGNSKRQLINSVITKYNYFLESLLNSDY